MSEKSNQLESHGKSHRWSNGEKYVSYAVTVLSLSFDIKAFLSWILSPNCNTFHRMIIQEKVGCLGLSSIVLECFVRLGHTVFYWKMREQNECAGNSN